MDTPAKLNKNGGTVPVSILATLLKMSVKVSAVNKGWIKYHNGPRMVCL